MFGVDQRARELERFRAAGVPTPEPSFLEIVDDVAAFNYASAKEKLNKILNNDPQNYYALIIYAHLSFSIRRADKAISYLEKALSISKNIDVVRHLLQLYLVSSRFSKIEEVLNGGEFDKLEGFTASKIYYKAVLMFNNGEYEKAKEFIQRSSGDLKGDGSYNSSLYNLLGKIAHELGVYDEAYNFFEIAKKSQHTAEPKVKSFHELYYRKLKGMEDCVSQGLFKQVSVNEFEKLPFEKVTFLCGYPRSGTSLAQRILSVDDNIMISDEFDILNITMSRVKALHGISFSMPEDVLNGNNIELLKIIREEFLYLVDMYFEGDYKSHYICKLPQNIAYIPILSNIFPEAKFVVMQRNAEDSIFSCFSTVFVPSEICSSALTLKTTIQNYLTTMVTYNNYMKIPELREKTMDISYETIVSDFEKEVKLMCNFIGVPYLDDMKRFDKKGKSKVMSASANQVDKSLYDSSVGKWQKYRKYYEPHLIHIDRLLNRKAG